MVDLATFPVGVAAYFLIFLGGLAGSFHCVGMCGGFACAVGTDPRGRRATVTRHLIYNSGRVTAYCLLGIVAGVLGMNLIGHNDSGTNHVAVAQRLLSTTSGVLMLFIGMRFLGFFRHIGNYKPGYISQMIISGLRDLLKVPSPAVPLVFGIFNGFLPCPLVYAFVVLAGATGGPLSGALVMMVFGLGTYPAMLLMGGIGTQIRSDWRILGVRIAGMFIVILGLITLMRGALLSANHSDSLLRNALAWGSILMPGPQ